MPDILQCIVILLLHRRYTVWFAPLFPSTVALGCLQYDGVLFRDHQLINMKIRQIGRAKGLATLLSEG
jgi:hypothetical protein